MRATKEENMAIGALSSDAFWSVNKALATRIGIEEAVLVSELIYKFKYWRAKNMLDGQRGFFYTSADIQASMPVSIRAVKRLTKSVAKSGIVKIKKRGSPAKNYWYLNWKMLSDVLTSEAETVPTGEYETEPTSEAETVPAITNKSDEENSTYSAAYFIKSPFEQEKKKTKILKTEDKELSTSIYEILDKSKYTIEHSKTLTNKIAVAVRRHGLEALKKAVSSRIQYQASAGRDLYIHHFLADAPAIEWHIARSQTLPTPTKSNLPDFSHVQYDDAPFDEHAMDEFKVTHA